MNYPTINLQGHLLSAEMLGALEQDAPHQEPKDFGLDPGERVKDEIARVWSEALHQWRVFQSKKARLKEGATGTTETRQFWMVPLLDALGYRLTLQPQAEVVAGRTYAISHRDEEIDGFPVYITGFGDSLDKRRETGGPRLSPHALVQEYLNLTEHLYALVTNGHQLRLLRDSSRLTRLSYVEFDLVRMMEEEAFPDFAVMYRLLHRSRMPQAQDAAAESVVEQYHQNALEAGAAIRERLSGAVREGIAMLASALLQDPRNAELRRRLAGMDGDGTDREDAEAPDDALRALGFYNQLLRLVYRLLFLLVIEERDLVFPREDDDHDAAPDGKADARQVYRDLYGVSRLRRLAERPHFADERRHDLWISLFSTFRLFERAEVGRRLGIAPLAGELFGEDAVEALRGTRLDNGTLLRVLDRFFRFENKEKLRVNVNYAALNVEEFGSVYEGLLELRPLVHAGMSPEHARGWAFSFGESEERSKTGSHYTPDELVRPLVEHGLDPVIEAKLAPLDGDPEAVEEALLSLRVCDVACGSGHFLLAAARRIAYRLAQARTGEEQPNPASLRRATRDVIGHCIYGVDVNPMAVDLCKVALWLEAHDPGKPLTFLDHRIKCGNAVVGLARADELRDGIPNEAFKRLPGDDKDVSKTLRDRNKDERGQRSEGAGLQLGLEDTVAEDVSQLATAFRRVETMDDGTLDGRQAKAAAFAEATGAQWLRWKRLADAAVAPFFQRKTPDMRGLVPTDGMLRRAMNETNPQHQWLAATTGVATEKRVFHWFLEFPEVMDAGGFDCILGNPPYRGEQFLSGDFGSDFLEWVKFAFAPAGAINLVGFFARRIYDLLKHNGHAALIATNTLWQGDTRLGSLAYLVEQGGMITFAIRSMPWPGIANLDVTLLAIYKGSWNGSLQLDGREAKQITSHLSDEEKWDDPVTLRENEGECYQGSIVLGMGFVLEPEEARAMIAANPLNAHVVKPYLNGEDLNSNPDVSPSRWVIDFRERSKSESRAYEIPFSRVEALVKPERQGKKDKVAREKWWLHLRPRPELARAIAGLDKVIVVSRVTKHFAYSIQPTDCVFSDRLVVFAKSSAADFARLQTTLHEAWVMRYMTPLDTRPTYAVDAGYQTFPFPAGNTDDELEASGEQYHADRAALMLGLGLGLTKLYNLFHTPDLTPEGIAEAYAKKDRPDVDTLTAYPARIEALRQLHRQMDEAVARAYGWDSLDLGHGFHEVDFLPENDRVRYTISPEARRKVLKRLLLLNHERHAEEEAAKVAKKKGAVKTTRKSQAPSRTEAGEGPLFGGAQGRPPEKVDKAVERPAETRPASAPGRSKSEEDRKAPDRKANPQFRRAVLAAELVERLRGTRGFGRMKLQKALYLCEKHAALQIKSDYLKEKHGPFDPGMMGNVEKILRQNKWAERVQRKNGHGYDYVPMERAGGHGEYYERYWGEADDAVQEMVDLLSGLNGRDAEIVATLYGVWLECLEKGEAPTNRALVVGALAWHPEKQKIPAREWEWWAEWMRQEGFVPQTARRGHQPTP